MLSFLKRDYLRTSAIAAVLWLLGFLRARDELDNGEYFTLLGAVWLYALFFVFVLLSRWACYSFVTRRQSGTYGQYEGVDPYEKFLRVTRLWFR